MVAPATPTAVPAVPTASTASPGAVVAPVVTPGNQTSEFNFHKYVMIIGGALTVALGICSQLQMLAPSGSKMSGYLTLAATIGGGALLVFKDLGYSSDRSDQKVAAIQAQGAVAAAQATAAAGQNAATAAAALK